MTINSNKIIIMAILSSMHCTVLPLTYRMILIKQSWKAYNTRHNHEEDIKMNSNLNGITRRARLSGYPNWWLVSVQPPTVGSPWCRDTYGSSSHGAMPMRLIPTDQLDKGSPLALALILLSLWSLRWKSTTLIWYFNRNSMIIIRGSNLDQAYKLV